MRKQNFFLLLMSLVVIVSCTTTSKNQKENNFVRVENGQFIRNGKPYLHIPADTRSAFPVISVQSPVSIQCCWQS